ncbi:hypothetical protein SY212_04270 [Ligilactobacillus agilis]|uniref:Uncharacterized protein n=1 Tax=Ligilactobacillus agilis TaxID=1601 RepID=A0A6F9XJK9_9LACO|nr:hypothetical protein [Ligilactobacillus agilis]GET05397.1 hypothetical protein SY212_04270 [Ligilactobacillus agilis]
MKTLANKGLYPKCLIKVNGLQVNPQDIDEDYSIYFRLDQAGLLSQCLDYELEYLLDDEEQALYNRLTSGSIFDFLSNAKRLHFIQSYEIKKVK